MGSPFKMNPKSPFMKALVGKQGNLPQHLQDAIKAAPESPAKSYGKSPMKKNDKVKMSDVVIGESKKTVKRRDGGKNVITTQTVEKGGTYSTDSSEDTMGQRKGRGRIGTKTYARMEGTGKKGSLGAMTGSTISGTETDKRGRTKMRTLADGSKVVVEGSVSKIKKKGVQGPKITTSELKKSKGKSPAKMKGVAGLKKKSKATKTTASKGMPKAPNAKMQARVKSVGKKGSPVKSTKNPGGKRKLGTEGMTYKEKLAYYEKQKKAKAAKNPKVRMGMGTSYTTIKK